MTEIKYEKLSDIFNEQYGENVEPIFKSAELDKIKPLYHNEILSSNPPTIKNILSPWLQDQGIAFIFAGTGVGKTLFAMNSGYTVAQGGNFIKFKAAYPRRVLYIDGEMAYSQMYKRYKQIVSSQGDLDFPENFALLNPDSIYPFKLPKISSLKGQEFYNKLIEREKSDVIFFDNLSVLSDFDENSAESWQPIQDWILSLRSLGKSIVIIHHEGKNGSYRGTSRMIDAVDTVIHLKLLPDDGLENQNNFDKKIKLTYLKHRHFDGADATEFEIILPSVPDTGWQYQSVEVNLLIKIVDCCKAKMSQRDISKEVGRSQSTVNKFIKRARKEGLLNE